MGSIELISNSKDQPTTDEESNLGKSAPAEIAPVKKKSRSLLFPTSENLKAPNPANAVETKSRSALMMHEEPGSKNNKHPLESQGFLDFKKRLTFLISAAVFIGCFASISLEFFALYFDYENDEKYVNAAAITGLVLVPTVLLKQVIICRMESLRAAHNKIRMEINRFMDENIKLHQNVDELEIQVKRVEDTEMKLSELTQKSNDNTLELVSLVKNNEKYVKRLGELAKEEFQEALLTTVLKSDRDNDFKITDREVRALIARFKGKQGFHLDEEKLYSLLDNSDGSIRSIMKFLRDCEIEPSA